jgi:hypothetical protein
MVDERIINGRILSECFIDKSKFYIEYLTDYMKENEEKFLILNKKMRITPRRNCFEIYDKMEEKEKYKYNM